MHSFKLGLGVDFAMTTTRCRLHGMHCIRANTSIACSPAAFSQLVAICDAAVHMSLHVRYS